MLLEDILDCEDDAGINAALRKRCRRCYTTLLYDHAILQGICASSSKE